MTGCTMVNKSDIIGVDPVGANDAKVSNVYRDAAFSAPSDG